MILAWPGKDPGFARECGRSKAVEQQCRGDRFAARREPEGPGHEVEHVHQVPAVSQATP